MSIAALPSELPTNWPRVVLVVAAGIAGAVHIGKVPGALPVLAAELKLDLVMAGLLTAIFSLVAATAALMLGLAARRVGASTMVVAGLALATLASIAGMGMQSPWPLLATRIIEGLGFIMVAVGAPPLIISATVPRDRRLAMGLWGTYVPAGTSLMMFVTALTLEPLGWRGVWGVAAAITGALSIAVFLAARPSATPGTVLSPPALTLRENLALALAPASRRLALCFAIYGAQYLAVVAFLPTLLVETAGQSLALAGVFGALVAASNALGNVAAGWLGARGWRIDHAVALGAVGMGVFSLPIFIIAAPAWFKVCSAIAFCAIGGLIPGTLLGAAPRVAPSPAAAAAVVGLMIQGAGVGQLLGPPLLAEAVRRSGSWSGALAFTIPAALALLVISFRLRSGEPNAALSDTPAAKR